jgi:alpha-L-rhamnosidase
MGVEQVKPMHSRLFASLLFVGVISATVLAQAAPDADRPDAADLQAANLRCEYRHDPLGINSPNPRLSWQILSTRRGVTQAAFRILVASSESLLQADHGDLWDTGKTSSDRSIQIEYAGKALVSGQRCYWKVQVWDAIGRSSPWSKPAMWSMGLLKPADWTAQWIGPDSALFDASQKAPPPAPMLRKTFALTKPIRRATAYICGLGYYELYINGSKVGDHVLDPPVTQYDKRALYVTYDLGDRLNVGNNALGVVLGSSWYNSTVPDAWGFEKASWRALPQVRLQVEVEYQDGSVQQLVSDSSWKCGTGPLLFDQTRVGEIYDARLEKPGWATAEYDDSGWAHASLRQGIAGAMSASNVEPIKVVGTVKPIKVTEPKPGVFVFDIGQNLAGRPQLTAAAPAGTVVHMKCGELLNDDDGTVSQKNISQHVKSPEFQCDSYTFKGDGVETWEPTFTYHGFQYVQVDGLPGKPAADAVVAKEVRTSFDSAGSFECSNPLLNKIEKASVWSYASNFVGIPTDCPHREKNGWTGDAHLAAQMGLEHFHAEAAYAQWILTLEDTMRADGKLPGIAPTAGWGYNRLDGPAWESAYLLIPWQLYQQSGDTRILTSHYDGFKRWVDYYTRISKDHIVSYGLGDWAPVKSKTPAALTSTAFYHRDLLILAATAKLLNKDGEARQYDELAQEVRRAFNRHFYDAATGQYGGGTQTALACALYERLAEDSQRAKVAANLAENVRQTGNHIDTGILGAKYLLRALSDTGHGDEAWALATQRTAPSWGNWIDRGATTLWEEWDGSQSRNHIMFGDISSWFIEYLAGIRPDATAPGYKKIIVHPLLLGDLTSARSTRECMYGTISCSWARDGGDGKLTMQVVIPANTSATVYVPAGTGARVLESGKPASQAEGVRSIGTDGDDMVFAVGSGQYEFTAEKP